MSRGAQWRPRPRCRGNSATDPKSVTPRRSLRATPRPLRARPPIPRNRPWDAHARSRRRRIGNNRHRVVQEARQRPGDVRARDGRADGNGKADHGCEGPRDKRATQAGAGGGQGCDNSPREAGGGERAGQEAVRRGHEVSPGREVERDEGRVSGEAFTCGMRVARRVPTLPLSPGALARQLGATMITSRMPRRCPRGVGTVDRSA